MDKDVDICVLEFVKLLKKLWMLLLYLEFVIDVREGDYIYCFFYFKDLLKYCI